MSRSRRSCVTGSSPKSGWFVNCRGDDLMDPERFRRIEDLYHSAMRHDPLERSRFLHESCAGDEDMRREVESLFAWESLANEFMETSATIEPSAQRARSTRPMVGVT